MMTLPNLNKISFIFNWISIYLTICSPLWTIGANLGVHVVSYEAVKFILILQCFFWIWFKVPSFIKCFLFRHPSIIIIPEFWLNTISKFVVFCEIVIPVKFSEPCLIIFSLKSSNTHVIDMSHSRAHKASLIHYGHWHKTKNLRDYRMMTKLDKDDNTKYLPTSEFHHIQSNYDRNQN